MTAKKRWLINCADLTTQVDDASASSHITWSSSSSEKEDPRNFKYKKKFEVSFRSNQLISCKSRYNHSAIERSFKSTIADDVKPSKCGNRNFDESPVIGRLSLEETSPILSRTFRGNAQQISPVIGSGNTLKELKRKRHKCDDAKIIICSRPCDSPDYEHTQPTVIIESMSPVATSQGNNEAKTIEPTNSSQGSSEVIISSYSTSSVSEPKSDPVLYYHIVPKKKRYKKGGLASQLQKALQRRRTVAGIWKHEVYLSKVKNESDLLGGDFMHLSVSEMWTEFGVRLLKCRSCNATENDCVLVLNDDACASANRELKLYPPFNTKMINWRGETLPCHYNISKILFCNS